MSTDAEALAILHDCMARAKRAADALAAAWGQLRGSVDGERDQLWSACTDLDAVAGGLNDVIYAFQLHLRGGGR